MKDDSQKWYYKWRYYLEQEQADGKLRRELRFNLGIGLLLVVRSWSQECFLCRVHVALLMDLITLVYVPTHWRGQLWRILDLCRWLVDLLHRRESGNFSCWEPLKIWISWVGYDTKSLWRQRVRIVKIWIRRARETIQDLRGAKGARHDRDQLNLQIRQNQGSQKIWEFIQISQTVHCAGQTEDWAHKKTRSLASVPHPVQHDDPF